MSEELEAFRDALRQAGQPWSRRGVYTVGAGMVGWLVAQLVPQVWVAYVALVATVVVMVGWVFLVIAFFKRRRWARAHRPSEPPLPAEPGAS